MTLPEPVVTGMDKVGSFGAAKAGKAIALATDLATAGYLAADAGKPARKNRYAKYATAAANQAFNETVTPDGMAMYGAVAKKESAWVGENTFADNYRVAVLGTGKDKATGATTLHLRSTWDLHLTISKNIPHFPAGTYVTHYVDVIDVIIDRNGNAKASDFLNRDDDADSYDKVT